MKKWIVFFMTGVVLTTFSDDFSVQQAELEALSTLTAAPAMQAAEGFQGSENLKAIYYDALDYKGKPTKVFAWLGLPEKRQGKVPGIVLVHGGGGTAFKEWVEKWNAQGFAAISIAVEGQTNQKDKAATGPDNPQGWAHHEWAGPRRVGIYGDSNEPFEDQWMFHAVADTILANSLLRSLPEVDADKVGLMGVSWGGVITTTVIGLDDRFAFAIPTYGCGHLFDARNMYGNSLGNNELYKQVLDPVVRLKRVNMPVMWFSWPQDPHFPLDQQAASYRAMPGPVMVTLIPGMQHSHQAGWNPPDSYAFAQSVVATGKPWCRQIECRESDGECRVKFVSSKPLETATLVSTIDKGFTGSRKWIESPAALTREGAVWIATSSLPAGTTAWFINVRSGGLTVSSEFQEKE
jgi:dienelactone hydrolase